MSVKGMITGLILLWNLFVGILYGVDKEKAKRNDWRIPEKTLLFYAFAVWRARSLDWRAPLSSQNTEVVF